MSPILEPTIATKIAKMKERVQWQHSCIRDRRIDQTRLVLDDGESDRSEFSFLVIGDSGSGPHPDNHHPQRRIAEQMVPHLEQCNFTLHTGDVIYQVGSSEQYPDNFIKPYREWLVGGDRPEQIAYDRMLFEHPFLPTLGNHDYYNLPFIYGFFVRATRPLRRLLGVSLRDNIGLHGSFDGDGYARAFMDYLQNWQQPEQLVRHLDQHYTASTETGQCLRYQPGCFTRVPNRYYSFEYGGIEFFALDSSTFNTPSPLPKSLEGDRYRQMLLQQREEIAAQEQQLFDEAAQLDEHNADDEARRDDLQGRLEQLEEVKRDIEKQLHAEDDTQVDLEQLTWLRDRLIASWQNPDCRGRIIYFHHPPYVSEATKWHQGQTLAVRHHLRWALDGVAAAVGNTKGDRPVVDLVLNGHAHCFEYLRTMDTGHADAHMHWIVCGGSGLSLRYQRAEGAELFEQFPASEANGQAANRLVAKSQLYVGLTGQPGQRRRPYSFLRIDVKAGDPPQFIVRPYISERYKHDWMDYALEPLVL